LWDIETQKQL
jgi:WD40 repeat protein